MTAYATTPIYDAQVQSGTAWEPGQIYTYTTATNTTAWQPTPTLWFQAYRDRIPVARAIQAATDLHRLALACQFALLAERPDWHDDALPEEAPCTS